MWSHSRDMCMLDRSGRSPLGSGAPLHVAEGSVGPSVARELVERPPFASDGRGWAVPRQREAAGGKRKDALAQGFEQLCEGRHRFGVSRPAGKDCISDQPAPATDL